MSRNYKFHNPEGLYFVSFAVVGWLDVFTRNEYKDLIVESLEFCQQNKGMEIHSWCIMTNHVHLIFRSIENQKPELLLGDFKRFTSRSIIKAIQENSRESRKEFLLDYFKKEAAKSSNTTNYQFWRHDNKPIELWSNDVIQQKIEYIHNNPVEEGFVFRAEDYKYSSASDYAGEGGLLDGVCVFQYFNCNTTRRDSRGSGGELLKAVVNLYNNERPHMSIGNLTPNQVHQHNIKTEKLWKNYYVKSPIIVNQ